MGGQAIRGRAARLARAIRAVRKVAVRTGYVTTAEGEPDAQVRPIGATALAWDGGLGKAVDASPPGEAGARAWVVTEVIYEADPVLGEAHRENVKAAPAYWARVARAVWRRQRRSADVR